jgi:hypothetical protein
VLLVLSLDTSGAKLHDSAPRVPGTPLFFQMQEQGRMLPDVNLADIHGQHQFNFRHTAISREDSKKWLDWAFRRDFERNGPSIYRICRTTLEGWRRYRRDADMSVRARFAREARALSDGYAAALWAMERHLRRSNPAASENVRALRKEVGREFGLVSRPLTRVLGPVMLWSTRREERRLAAGHTYEPGPIIERRNWTWTNRLEGGLLEDCMPTVPAVIAQEEPSGS